MNGRLAVADLSAGTSTAVYQCPTDYAVATVTLVNRAYTPTQVRIAVGSNQTPNPEDYIEYDTEIPGKGHLERTGVSVQAGNYVVVESSAGDVNCVIWGTEVGT
jgi:hypothetical protein